MRVLIATDTFLPNASGIVRACLNLGEGLARTGHDVTVIGPRDPGGLIQSRQLTFNSIGVPARNFRPAGRRPIVSRRAARAAVADTFSNQDPEVVHVHTPWAIGQAALREAVERGVPTVLTMHLTRPNAVNHTFLAGLVPDLTWFVVQRTYKKCGRDSALISVPSAIGREHAADLFGSRPVTVMSNGVTPLDGCMPSRRVNRPTRLLYVGRLSKEKNVDSLIRSAASPKLRNEVRLDIVGSGPKERRLRRLARRLDAPVDFSGSLSDAALGEKYATADIFCMPSIAELECIAALEALSFELPIVAPYGSALDEMGRAISFYDCNDAQHGLAAAIETLISAPAKQAEHKEYGRKIVQSRSLTAVAHQWNWIYSRLVRSTTNPMVALPSADGVEITQRAA